MRPRNDLVTASLWGAVGGVACASVAGLQPSLLEEGLPLHVAQRLLRGDHLYRDVVFFTGPLPFEFLALLFRCFGEHLIVARAAVVILQGITTACVFGIARRAGAGVFAHVAAAVQASVPIFLFPLFSIYFPSTLAAQLSALAVYAAVRSTTSLRWAVLAGVLTACVALCKQTTGVALAISLTVGVVAYASAGRRWSTVGALVAGGLGVALVTLAAFAAQGTIGDLFESLVTMPLTLSDSFRTPFPALWPPGRLGKQAWLGWPFYLPQVYVLIAPVSATAPIGAGIGVVTQILYALPFLAILATIARAIFGWLPAAAALPVAAVIASTAGLFPRSDWGHLCIVLPAAAVQVVLVASAARSARGAKKTGRRVVAGLLLTGVGVGSVGVAVMYHRAAAPLPWDARIPVRPVSENYRTPTVPRVIEYLRARTSPGENIFVARQEPLLYFAIGARNPTRYEGMMQGLRERQEVEILEALESLRFVVMSELDQAENGFYSDELPAVQAYLERHFQIPDDFPDDRNQWLLVYERGKDRGATVIDLIGAAPDARHWVVGDQGDISEFAASTLPRGPARHLRRPLPVPVGPRGGGIDFALEIPDRARFQADIGIFAITSTKSVVSRSFGATYSVSIVRDGHAEEISHASVERDLDGQRTWQPFEVDLSPWAGQRVVLRMQVIPDEEKNTMRLAWWGSPRISVHDGAAQPFDARSGTTP